MAQTILIKRSTSTAVPSTLTNGELAYSSVDNGKLFIGRPGGAVGDVDAIGGKYYTDIISGATDAATADKLVLRDASGDFTANMITSDLTGAVTGTVSSLSNHTTAGLTEGTNLYYTAARARSVISASGSLAYNSTTGALTYTQADTDTVSEGAANLYYTDTRARASISASGSLSYDNSTGVVSYTTPTTIASLSNHDTGDLSEGTNLYYTDARARSAISASGSLSYSSATGALTYTQGNTDTVSEGTSNLYHTTERAQDAAAAMITGATHGNISVSYDDVEGTLAFTAASQYSDSDARAAISVTDAGGDGSLSYSSATGVITYNGPTAAQARAHFSGGTGVTISNGSIAIGQAVSTTSNVTFNNVSVDGTLTSDDITSANISVTGNATITGNLTVEGTTTTVNSTNVSIADNVFVLNKDEAGAGVALDTSGIEIERGSLTNVSLLWNETSDYWQVSDGVTTSKLMTADNWAASFTGTVDGGTF